MIDYKGQVALVTGGASGIGLALAQALHARGARTILADVNEAGLAAAAQQLGAGCTVLACDLSQPADQAGLVERALQMAGRIDIVCSNAGVGRNKRVLKEAFDDVAERVLAVNLRAGVRIAQAYHAHLDASGRQGRILFTASENSLAVPSAVRGSGLGLYAASKHGLLVMAEWLRDETAGGPMAVHVLLPGAVYTPLIQKALPDPALAPPALNLIMPERAAEVALKGLDHGLFYIPTQRHLADDMRARFDGVRSAVEVLGL
jgi:NAD(P)-dependent dehydrogenase (short-subunit alcohol dehydrogenase family)